jgi:Gas vesicle synthesis protein GvpL/GvpF
MSATWVYAVTGDLDSAVLDDLEGISGARVREVHEGQLLATASSVDAGAFSEEALQRRLADPGELEAMARAHHHVIGTVAEAGTVLPLRLGTVYREDGGVHALLAERQPEFAATLDWLTGRAECGVKVWASPAALAAGSGRAESPGPAGAGGGAAYLSRRRDELAARDQASRRAAEAAAGIHDELSSLAVAGRQHQPQDAPAADPGSTQARDVMVLNGAYLVAMAGLAEFAAGARAAVAGLAGFRLDVTGPWPPYSFADGPAEGEV